MNTHIILALRHLKRVALGASLAAFFGLATPANAAPAKPATPTPVTTPAAVAAIAGKSVESLKGLRDFIVAKLEYDLQYFQSVLALKSKGQTDPRVTAEVFAGEVKRAEIYVPVLSRFFGELKAQGMSKPFRQPGGGRGYQVYNNLIAILNMLQAYENNDFNGAIHYGKQIEIEKKENLGLILGSGAHYYVKLYREYFYMMASANYRLGNDTEAVKWLARLEADTDLQNLKKNIAAATAAKSASDDRYEKLAALRVQAMAVLPFDNLAPGAETDWMGRGIAEFLASDLSQHTGLTLIERAQLDKVLGEAALAQAGVTLESKATDIGKMLNAGVLFTGSYRLHDGKVTAALRIVEAATAQVLAAETINTTGDAIFAAMRESAIKLLTGLEWLDAASEASMMSARVPRRDTVRDLVKARLLMSTKAEEAKALYAKAIREEPSFANAFEDLKKEFADVSASVAVMPFVNVSGRESDVWMIRGAVEALANDLSKLRFTVVERSQLESLLRNLELGQVLDQESSIAAGKKVGADFLVMGSILHQEPRIRVDARFVEVRTGVVVFSTSVESPKDDFMAVLVQLTTEIANGFNQQLSKESIEQLAAKKMSKDDFEKYIRQELARESLQKNLAPTEVRQEPSRAPFWAAAGTAVAGTALGVTGLVIGDKRHDEASYNDALATVALQEKDKQASIKTRDENNKSAKIWNGVAFTGLGLAVLSVGYIVYDEITSHPRMSTTINVNSEPTAPAPQPAPQASLTPTLDAGPDHAVAGLAAAF